MNEEKPSDPEILVEKVQSLPPPEEEDYEAKYLRLLADVDNTRKRMQKEKQEMTRFAIENILSEILMPIDTFESALGFTDQMGVETKNWARGFEMILAQFKEILQSHHVTPFHSKGERFDPHKHEAVEVEETEKYPEGTVVHEFLKGYKSGDRVLRPAKVKVSQAPSDKSQTQQE